MFQAGVIIILLLWAVIVLMLSGFMTGLIFMFFLISASLFCLTFLLLKIAGLAASVPLALYALLTLVIGIGVWVFSEPVTFLRVKTFILQWTNEKILRRGNS